ncbi:hypothetical protein GOP47_0024893 [Adiantum capillus-veneris]|uniref:Uncharacterized protein n=1 Tax=Adiantum capillus-veneris TaxID=13818 RepID=A0A9D4Z314_ADICA|nr:hypothetical protein GOP47_0024893 [Adiantum capillus-veneris]
MGRVERAKSEGRQEKNEASTSRGAGRRGRHSQQELCVGDATRVGFGLHGEKRRSQAVRESAVKEDGLSGWVMRMKPEVLRAAPVASKRVVRLQWWPYHKGGERGTALRGALKGRRASCKHDGTADCMRLKVEQEGIARDSNQLDEDYGLFLLESGLSKEEGVAQDFPLLVRGKAKWSEVKQMMDNIKQSLDGDFRAFVWEFDAIWSKLVKVTSPGSTHGKRNLLSQDDWGFDEPVVDIDGDSQVLVAKAMLPHVGAMLLMDVRLKVVL